MKRILEFLKFAKKYKILHFIIIWIIVLIIISLCSPLISLLYKHIIDLFDTTGVKWSYFFLIIIAYIFFEFVAETLENIQGYVDSKINYGISHKIIESINYKLSRVKLEEYEKNTVYDLVERIKTNFLDGLFDKIKGGIYFFSPLVSIISYSCILITYGTIYLFLLFIFLFPYLALTYYKSHHNYKQQVELTYENKLLSYVNTVLLQRIHIKEVKFFGLTNYLSKKSYFIRRKIYQKEFKLQLKYILIDLGTNILRGTVLAFSLILYITNSKQNTLTAGDFFLLINIIQKILLNIDNSTVWLQTISDYSFYYKDWNRFMSLPEEKYEEIKDIENYKIKINNLFFMYPNSDSYILKNISLEIDENERVAVVGENGSGKSTLIKILLGIYQPSKGCIFVGKDNLNDILYSFRKIAVCIFQDYIRYQMTVGDNIKAGNFGKENCNFNINGLGVEFDKNMMLGQIDKNGTDLSGGQWQKLALLRALYRENSKILVMDEPISNLDPKTENDIYEHFFNITKNKTLILISHRLSVAKLCDRIIVMSDGKIVEQGTHNELMKLRGKYYHMYVSQSELYK